MPWASSEYPKPSNFRVEFITFRQVCRWGNPPPVARNNAHLGTFGPKNDTHALANEWYNTVEISGMLTSAPNDYRARH